jgi:hypothetical protein
VGIVAIRVIAARLRARDSRRASAETIVAFAV